MPFVYLERAGWLAPPLTVKKQDFTEDGLFSISLSHCLGGEAQKAVDTKQKHRKNRMLHWKHKGAHCVFIVPCHTSDLVSLLSLFLLSSRK